MDDFTRWLPILCVLFIIAFASANAWRLGRRLGHSPITVFRSRLPAERRRIALAILGVVFLAATSIWPALLDGVPGLPTHPVSTALGCVTLAGALLLALLAFRSLGDSWRIGVDEEHATELITSGIYARVRHPIYTAFIGCFLGLFFIDPNIVYGAYLITGTILCRAQAIREERFLAERHPDYDAYSGRTGRFLPRLAGRRRRT